MVKDLSLWCGQRDSNSWTRSNGPQPCLSTNFSMAANMTHIKSMTSRFQIDKFLIMEFNQEVKKATDSIYQKISKVMPEIEWSTHAPYIHKINKLKKEKNAIILAHNYQTLKFIMVSLTFQLTLSSCGRSIKNSADIIVMAGVHFMAETTN